ncbi:hypothetical protein DFH06DRAFT_1166345 [Mycena polygramma]|nr:hypothetical protein DFH06DRAFT_1166345 [Mycena polygramma]
MYPTSLRDIPAEILSEILGFIHPKTLLLVCSSVCHLWHTAVKSSPELQYTIELWADGMVRGNSAFTCAETLEALYQHRRAWSTLEWTSKTVVDIEALDYCRAYEFVSGIFAQQQHGPDFLAVSLSTIVDDPKNARVAHAIGSQVPNIEDFAIAPTQDLIALLTTAATPGGLVTTLELRTISSQEFHPLASNPSFPVGFGHDPTAPLSIQIADDVIGILFFRDRFVLRNWKANILITEVNAAQFLKDFHFLSPRSYIFAYHDDVDRISIFTFDGARPNSSTEVATLGLPERVPGSYISSILVQAGQFCANPYPGAPFSKSNDHRIYMFLIHYSDTYWCRLFIHIRCFQQYILDYVRDNNANASIIPWEQWGPQNSRMLPGADNGWNRQVYGERVALPCQDPDIVQILDFGITPRRPTIVANAAPYYVQVEFHLDPSSLELEEVFVDTVTTALPYSITTGSADGNGHNLFLIDQDRLIGMTVHDVVPSHQMTVYTL